MSTSLIWAHIDQNEKAEPGVVSGFLFSILICLIIGIAFSCRKTENQKFYQNFHRFTATGSISAVLLFLKVSAALPPPAQVFFPNLRHCHVPYYFGEA